MPLKQFAILSLILCGVLVGCGRTDPVLNVRNAPIVAPAGTQNLQNIKRTIILAGTRTGWQMRASGPGLIVGTIFRGGHMAKVNVEYSADRYSIIYNDSSNLGYDGEGIHQTYNRWVTDLDKNIRKALAHSR